MVLNVVVYGNRLPSLSHLTGIMTEPYSLQLNKVIKISMFSVMRRLEGRDSRIDFTVLWLYSSEKVSPTDYEGV